MSFGPFATAQKLSANVNTRLSHIRPPETDLWVLSWPETRRDEKIDHINAGFVQQGMKNELNVA